METTIGWCKWYVKDDYLIDAITQLDEHNVDMTKVFIIPFPQRTGINVSDYIIIYKNEKEVTS